MQDSNASAQHRNGRQGNDALQKIMAVMLRHEISALPRNFELVYEAREFALNLRRDITIARNADFWEALRVIGETYRKSDGAFQVLPTEFKQIVILPMGQNTVATQ